MSDPRDIFPERLEQHMAARSVDVAELAEQTGVEVEKAQRWFDGVDWPCPREFQRVAAYLQVDRDDLLT